MNCLYAEPGPLVLPMCRVMQAYEAEAGRVPITPDNAPDWLNRDDWRPWPVLSIGTGELHIVAVNSVRPGALRRLIEGAAGVGLRPVIVAPIGSVMPAILAKWDWVRTIGGQGFDRRDEWRPK